MLFSEVQINKRRHGGDFAVDIKRGCIITFAYQMSSSAPLLVVDYFAVISFCVKIVQTVLSHSLNLGTFRRERTRQTQALIIKSKTQDIDQHVCLNNARRLHSARQYHWGGSGKEGSEDR